jgi:hypothetical protein
VLTLAALALTVLPAAAGAQALAARGRVVFRADSASTTPLAGAWVTLHEVTMSGGGPIDSVRTDREGRYRVRVAQVDTAALYMVSAGYSGITYFSDPTPARGWRDTIPPLEVYDTSSTAPAIAVGQRHVVVRRSGADGGRSVLELVSLVNRGTRTRISPDSVAPVWSGRLPRGATAFQVGESDVSADAVEQRDDRVMVTAPIPPGRKQIVFTYALPGAGELVLPLDQPAERLLVLLEDTAAVLAEGPLEKRGVEMFDDTPFALFDGAVPTGGGQAVFRLGRRRLVTPQTLAYATIALAAVLMLLAVPLLRRRGRGVAVAIEADTPEALARAIAALDAGFEAGDRSPAAETAYRERRAHLKARLAALLGAGPPRG